MATRTATLRQVLSQKKPSVLCNSTATKNTADRKWPSLEGAVTIWEDFNLDNLNDSYGHVLDLTMPCEVLGPDQLLADVTVNGPNGVKNLIRWNEELMKPTIQFAKSQLGIQPGVRLRQTHSAADKSNVARIPAAPPGRTVDHVISLDDFPGPNLVVGLGRPSSKWDGCKLANQLDKPTMELLWPLRQLAKLCDTAKTRYGYLQTENELVVSCFSKVGEDWKAAIMPIPWSRYGVEALTTDLALWWLCMLAMSAHHNRIIVHDGEMARINDWDLVFLGEERGWVRRHRYSNVEKPSCPPPPPAYQSLSPSNAVALAAAMDLQTAGQFNSEDANAAGLVDPKAVGIAAYVSETDTTISKLGDMDFDFI